MTQMSSSVDYRDETIQIWNLSKRQDYSTCGAKPGVNIMPVELAIRRELAYRKGTMTQQSQIHSRSRDAFMSGKETSPNPSFVGIKRKEPSCNSQCLPKPSSSCQPLHKRSVGPNRKFALDFKQRARVGGYRNMFKWLKENQEFTAQKGDQLWCILCNVPCSGECSLAQHFMGKKHAARINEINSVKRVSNEAAHI